MKVIQTMAELQMLKNSKAFLDSFLTYIEQEWLNLLEAFSDGEEKEKFSLELHSKQVILEPGDNLLKGLGETYWPEYLEKVQTGDAEIFRMYVMEAEDYGILYYWPSGSLDDESEMILRNYTEENPKCTISGIPSSWGRNPVLFCRIH